MVRVRATGGRALALLSALVLLALLGLPASAGLAQGLPPRPTPAPSPVPTSAPSSGGSTDDSGEEPGRITGTVIDQTTGAPASGIAVRVGDQTVTSDANGNYDRSGLASGVYTVTLVLSPSQGTPSQGTVTVTVAAGATVVQHLFFRSPVRPTAATQPPTPTPPTPASLPNTGAPDGSSAPLALLGLLLVSLGAALALRRTHP
jgi:hypothetical protein